MNITEIIILAVAMSIDAFIVSFSYGLILKNSRLKNSLILSLSFGFFQFIMPVLGWFSISLLYSRIERFSEWIIFIIFIILAAKFLYDALFVKEKNNIKCISPLCLFCLSVATSVDAFGAGVNIKLLGNNILYTSSVIGTVTVINSFIGFWISDIFKNIPSKYIEIIGSMLFLYLAFKAVI